MSQDELEKLTQEAKEGARISAVQLANKSPRTLIYGYTTSRDTFHVYLDEKSVLHRLVYDHYDILTEHVEGSCLPAADCVPNKRIYPECCDYEVCRLLLSAGVRLPFTSYSLREPVEWAGKRASELKCVPAEALQVPELRLTLEDLGLAGGRYSLEAEKQVEAAMLDALRRQAEGYVRATLSAGAREDRFVAVAPTVVEFAINLELENRGHVGPWDGVSDLVRLSDNASEIIRERIEQTIGAHLAKFGL